METRVLYKAMADFSNLRKEIRQTKRELEDLKRAEATYNSRASRQNSGGNTQAASGRAAIARSNRDLNRSYAEQEALSKAATRSIRDHAAALIADAAAARRDAEAQERLNRSLAAGSRASTARVAGTRNRPSPAPSGGSGSPPPGAGGAGAAGAAAANSGNQARKGAAGWKAFVSALPKAGIFLAIAASLPPVIAGLGSLVPALFGAVGGLVQLSSVALAAPGALAALFSAIAGGIFATRGIGDAFKAYGQQQKAVGAGAGQTARQQVSAARQITQAQERLKDAYFEAGRAREDAAERVHDADRALIRAERDYTRAQKGTNDAREQAIQDLEELRDLVSDASLSEERAIANLAKARDAYNNTFADPAAQLGDKLDAAASLKEAEQDLQDVRADNIKNVAALATAEAKGVAGADVVVSAVESQEDAYESLRDARTEAQRAAVDQGRQEVDSARAIRDAAWALEEAQASANEAMSGGAAAANVYEEALAKLSPSARKFVEGIIAMKEAFEAGKQQVQEAFFAPLVPQLGNLNSLIPVFTGLLTKSAGALGQVAAQGIAMLASGPFTRDFGIIGDNNAVIIGELGDAALILLDGFRNLAVIAGPFLKEMASSLKEGADNFRDWTTEGRKTGEIADKLELARERASQFWQMAKNILVTLGNLTDAGSEFIDWAVDGAVNATEKWRLWSAAQEEQGSAFKTYLEDAKPLLEQVGALLSNVVTTFAQIASDPENIERATDSLRTLRTDILPAIVQFLNDMRDSGLTSAITDVLLNLAEAFGNLVDSGVGGFLVTFVNTLNVFAEALNLITSIPGIGLALGTIGSALGIIAAVNLLGKAAQLSGIATALTRFNTVATPAAAGAGRFSTALSSIGSTLKGGVIAVGIAAAAAAVVELFQAINAPEVVAERIDGLMAAFENADTSASKVSTLRTAIDDLAAANEKAQETVDGGNWLAFGDMTEAREQLRQGGEALDDLREKQEAYRTNLDQVTTSLGLTEDAAYELADRYGIDLSASSRQVGDAMLYAKNQVYGVDGNSRELIEGWTTLADTTKTLTERAGGLRDVLDELRGDTGTVLEATADYNDALLTAQERIAGLAQPALDASGGLDLTTQSGIDAFNALNDLVSGGNDYIEKLAAMGDTQGALAADTALRASFDDLTGRLGLSDQAADLLSQQLFGLPEERRTAIELAGVTEATTAAQGLNQAIANIQGRTGANAIVIDYVYNIANGATPYSTGTSAGPTNVPRQSNGMLPGLFGFGGRHGGVMVESYAEGGIRPNNFAPLPRKGGLAKDGANLINWAEPGTGGEALIPLGQNNRPRSKNLLGQVAEMFGLGLYDLTGKVTKMAQGGMTGISGGLKSLSTQAQKSEQAVFDPLVENFEETNKYFDRALPMLGDDIESQWKSVGGDTDALWAGVSKTWSGGLGAIQGQTDSTLSRLLGAFGSTFSTLQSTAGSAVTGISNKWSGLNNALLGPIRDFVNVALNQWVLGRLNPVLANLNVAQIPVVGLNDGGPAPEAQWSGKQVAGTGYTDTVPAILTPGEFVLRKAASAADGVLPFMRMLNGAGSNAGNLLRQFQDMGAQRRADGGTIDAMTSWVKTRFPSARRTSAYRPGDSGYHGKKQAIDIGAATPYPGGSSIRDMLTMNQAIGQAFPNSTQLIHGNSQGVNLLDGRPHTYSRGTMADHYNHVHWAMKTLGMFSNNPNALNAALRAGSDGTIATAAMGMGPDGVYTPPSQVPLLRESMAQIPSLLSARFPGGGALNGMFRGGAQRAADASIPYVEAIEKKKNEEAIASFSGSGGAARWAGVVSAVLAELGLPQSYAPGVLNIIDRESGGNPNAINNWDSNARAGIPSQGLMQTIPGTFRAYAGPYANRPITDPYANIYAGVNYAMKRYGGGMLASGGRKNSSGQYMGYETGGVAGLPPELLSGAGLASLSQTALAEVGLGGGSSGEAGSSSVTNNRGFHVEQLHIHNPRRERASDSLPRSIRKVAYLRG